MEDVRFESWARVWVTQVILVNAMASNTWRMPAAWFFPDEEFKSMFEVDMCAYNYEHRPPSLLSSLSHGALRHLWYRPSASPEVSSSNWMWAPKPAEREIPRKCWHMSDFSRPQSSHVVAPASSRNIITKFPNRMGPYALGRRTIRFRSVDGELRSTQRSDKFGFPFALRAL